MIVQAQELWLPLRLPIIFASSGALSPSGGEPDRIAILGRSGGEGC